jgi:hypothetical protein
MEVLSHHDHDQQDNDEEIDLEGETMPRSRGLSFQYKEKSPSPNNNDDSNVETTQQQQQQQQQHPTKPRQERHNPSSTTSSIPEQPPPQPQLPHMQQNPLTVFTSILKDIAQEQIIKPYATAFPQSTVENVGIVAMATTLAIPLLQLPWRRSSHHQQRHNNNDNNNNNNNNTIMMTHVIAYIALSSVTIVSFGSILTREVILGNIHDKQSMKLACRDMVLRIMNKIKRNVLSNKTSHSLPWSFYYYYGGGRSHKTIITV